MTDQTSAQAEPLDDPEIQSTAEIETDGSANPEADNVASETTDEPAKPKEDGYQKRINKVTADKYEQQRRADAAEAKLKELEAKAAPSAAPTLEDFDFDDVAFQAALIERKVEETLSKREAEQQKALAQQEQQKAADYFGSQIEQLAKPDFDDVASSIPTLPEGVAGALMQSEGGAEMIYHLGTHLDVAEKIAGMTPSQAMMELGRISANMTADPVKTSAAPEPLEPLSGGGSLSQKGGPVGATFE